MKKIMPVVIVTAAVVAAATYIKKKIDKQEKVNLIEVGIKPKQNIKKTIEKVNDAAGDIVSVSKDILIETVDTVSDMVETFIEDPADISGILQEAKEGIEEIQEIIADSKNEDEGIIMKELAKDEDIESEKEVFEKNLKEEENVVEQALLINSIVANVIEEEKKFINETISHEIEKLIDEVVEDDENLDISLEETAEENLSIENIMEEVALQTQEHIEEVLSSAEENPLEPIDLPKAEDETVLKIVDETVGGINLINDIIESLEDDDTVEDSIEDLEDIVETATYEEPTMIDDSRLSEEQLLEKCIGLYTGIKENKIKLIIKQIDTMLETVASSEMLKLQHFATFATNEDKERYASIAAIEGHQVAYSDNDKELIILNTLDTGRISLIKSILQLAQDLTEYNGSYKGWTIS